MKIVVVGASGNVGTALLRRLADNPSDRTIVGVCRRPPADAFPYNVAAWQKCDISTASSAALLRNAFADADVVVHAAWAIQPNRDTDYLHQVNVEGSRRVFDAAVDADVSHLVYLSSVGTYSTGRSGQPVAESWPAGGVADSHYSRDKAAVEYLLDRLEAREPEMTITRLRPGLIFQAGAASEIARYFLGRVVPLRLVGLASRWGIPVVPLPADASTTVVHADDVALAIDLAIAGRIGGAFNLCADPPLDPERLAALLGGRWLPTPLPVVRAAAALCWRLRLQATDPSWVDLAAAAPLLDTTRARAHLGWQPQHDSEQTLHELIDAMGRRAGQPSPPLREKGTPTSAYAAERPKP